MFETLKDLFRPIIVADADFGRMRFLRQSQTWECMTHFPPLDRQVEVLIFGVETGPTTAQRQKWLDLVQNFSVLAPQAESAVAAAVASLKIPSFTMQLAAISIPEVTEAEYDVELTFGHPSGPPQFDVRIASLSVRDVIGPL